MAWYNPPRGSSGWGGGNRTSSPTSPAPLTREQQGGQQALNAFTGFAAPQFALNDINAERLAGQLGYVDAQYGLGVNQLQQNTALDRARLGLNANDIGINRDSINRQIGVNDQLHTLARQLLGIDEKGFQITQEELDAGLRDDKRMLDNALWKLRSEKTAMGSVGSVAHRRGITDIGEERNSAFGSYLRGLADLGLDKERLGVDKKRTDIEFGESGAKLKDRLKTINNEAAKLGIDGKQLEANLQQGLARLGVDQRFATDDLFDAIASNDIERAAIAQQIIRDALAASPYFTNNIPFPGGGGGGFSGRGSSGSW